MHTRRRARSGEIWPCFSSIGCCFSTSCKARWLDGRQDFLRAQVDRCLARGKGLDGICSALFLERSTPVNERTRTARAFGHIPFLNGGLFEPHPLGAVGKTIPTYVWRDVFDSCSSGSISRRPRDHPGHRADCWARV